MEQPLQRLEALGRRGGEAPPAAASEEGASATLGDLAQPLRVLERRLEEQAGKEKRTQGAF